MSNWYPRCAKHTGVRAHNRNAEDYDAECGACIMEEVWFLVESRLDILEVLADVLAAHAALRTRVSQQERRLAFYEPGLLKES